VTAAPRQARARGATAKGLAAAISCLLLVGCVKSLTYEETARGSVYVVRKGDTLYKIAWQHGLDQRDLARWNGIRDPDVIDVGQRLRLYAPRDAPVNQQAATPSASRPTSSATGTTSAPRTSAPAPRTTPAPQPRAASAPPSPTLPPPSWVWPTDGQVATRFGGTGGIATGIGIAGRAGQSIRAAAAGRIVYSGGGLIGYGQLVIIKHNDTFLSAYGYLNNVIVAQGQDVARGQTIAWMGQGPERQPRLHFVIRRNGTPVDPLLFLSAR
jgi:lipoprotein NlpD